jgi:hypothetical protein
MTTRVNNSLAFLRENIIVTAAPDVTGSSKAMNNVVSASISCI